MKIYIVIGSFGAYDTREVWMSRAFTDEHRARAYAEKLAAIWARLIQPTDEDRVRAQERMAWGWPADLASQLRYQSRLRASEQMREIDFGFGSADCPTWDVTALELVEGADGTAERIIAPPASSPPPVWTWSTGPIPAPDAARLREIATSMEAIAEALAPRADVLRIDAASLREIADRLALDETAALGAMDAGRACDRCGRKTWGHERTCDMTQPDGTRCPGRFGEERP